MKSGIYKITSPSGRVYIGQSVDIGKREKTYKNLRCKGQPKLYNSFLKYGYDSHTFEIIEECPVDQLNERERHWQDHYDSINKGLNCKATTSLDKTGYLSLHSCEKMRKSMTGKMPGDKNPMFGKTHSEEAKSIISISQTGRIKTSKEIYDISERMKRGSNVKAKIVLDTQTGIFFDCAKDAGEAYNISYSRLRSYLQGAAKNRTSLIYC